MSDRRPVQKDFDDPEVRRLVDPPLDKLWSAEAYALYGPPHDTPHDVAVWFDEQHIEPVLDVGCGSGAFRQSFSGGWVGLDRSIEQLLAASGRRVLGDALALPFPDDCFPGVVALYMLYFFEQPSVVVSEARRVLAPGGTFATCAPSRYDCPELHHVLPAEAFAESFASEDIPGTLERFFDDVEITMWDAPMFDLPDRETVRDYLHAHYYPLFSVEAATEAAARVDVPLKLTKRGAWGVGRKTL